MVLRLGLVGHGCWGRNIQRTLLMCLPVTAVRRGERRARGARPRSHKGHSVNLDPL